MYDNIGSKIKSLATVICVVLIILSIISGIAIMILSEGMVLVGILVAGLGSLFAWVSTFFIYGFGELIENTSILVRESKKISSNTKQEKASVESPLENKTPANTNSSYRPSANNISTKTNTVSSTAKPQTALRFKYCPHCGEAVNSRYCDMCGKKNDLF
jgi:hypothetical protein